MLSASYALFLFVLLFTPLAFGAVEPWALAIAEFSILTSFLLLAASGWLRKECPFRIPGMLPLLLFLGWMILQMLPLPVSILQALSPATGEIYAPLLEADRAIGHIPITLHPKAALLSFFKWSSCAIMYILTVNHLHNTRRLKQVITLITVFISLLAVQAILQKLTSPQELYWFRAAPADSSPTGPWVYGNQYAGFMGLVFPLIAALFLFHRPAVHYEKNFRDRIVAILSVPGTNRYLLYGAGAILVAVSILLSLSRGGIITLCVAFLVFTLFFARITHSRKIRWSIILTACVMLMISWFGWRPLIDEFESLWNDPGLAVADRLSLYRDTLAIFRSFPLFGTGFGSFPHVYPAFRTIPGEAVFDHVHSDYLELLAEGGLTGLLLWSWFLVTVLYSTIRTLQRRKEPFSILITCGILTGIFALLLHCLIDFQLASGANSLYLFFFLGLAVSASHTRLQFMNRQTYLDRRKTGDLPAIVAVLLLAAGSTWYNIGTYRAAAHAASIQPLYLNPQIPRERLREIHGILSEASVIDLLEPDYRIRMGNVTTLLRQPEQAQHEYLQACLLNPMSGHFLQQLGYSMSGANPSLQGKLIALGIKRELMNHERFLVYAGWLLQQNRDGDAVAVLRQSPADNRERAYAIGRFVVRNRFQENDIGTVLANRPLAWHELGAIMESEGRPSEAERYYLGTLDHLNTGEAVADYFRRPYMLLLRTGKVKKAIELLRTATEYLPDDPWFRVQLGDYYLREGIVYRAREEYMQGLRSDPGNGEIRIKLERIAETPQQ